MAVKPITVEQEFVDKQKKTTYNEFETLFMQWAYGSTEPGTLKAMYRPYGKKWVIYEKTDDGVVELFSDSSYLKARDEYDRIYEGTDAKPDRYFERFRTRQGDNNGNMLSDKNRKSNEPNSGLALSSKEFNNANGSGTDSFESDTRENLTNDERSTDNDGAFFDAKKQSKDSTDVDLDVIRSLTEANKQLTTELGKAKVTNEKLIERAKNISPIRMNRGVSCLY